MNERCCSNMKKRKEKKGEKGSPQQQQQNSIFCGPSLQNKNGIRFFLQRCEARGGIRRSDGGGREMKQHDTDDRLEELNGLAS